MTRTVPVDGRFAATPLAVGCRLSTLVVSRPGVGGPAHGDGRCHGEARCQGEARRRGEATGE